MTSTPDQIAEIAGKRQIDRDVDPALVAKFVAARQAYAEKTAFWGVPKRCGTNICDGDGSCVFCNAVQGESCLPVRDHIKGASHDG